MKFLSCIKMKKDYSGLYPKNKYDGAKIGIFSFYLCRFLGIKSKQLKRTQQLAKELFPESVKERKTYLKSDVFKEQKYKNLVRGKIIEFTEKEDFSREDYLSIFPVTSETPLKVDFTGWRILTYMFRHLEDEIPDYFIERRDKTMKVHRKIREAADLFFNDYIKEKGLKRFKKEVLEEMKRENPIHRFQNILLRLCEKHEGFGPADWDSFWHDLSHDENGNFKGYEFMFQFRLVLTEIYRNEIQKTKVKE